MDRLLKSRSTTLIFVALFFITTTAQPGCASRVSKTTVVLGYTDFGPQAMAYQVIGRKRLPWAPNTPLTPGDGGIFIVVFRGIEKARVIEAYPDNPDNNLDYRYVAYTDAISYLDKNIAQDILSNVTKRLETSRQTILAHLGAG